MTKEQQQQQQQQHETETRNMRKTVKWAKTCRMIFIPSLKAYSKEEKEQIWTSHDEYEQIRDECLSLTARMKRGVEEDNEVCYQGLEGLSGKMGRRRKNLRLRAAMAVFSENDRQFDMGICEPEAIRDAYIPLTRKCVVEAYERAKRDAEIATDIVAKPLHDCQEERYKLCSEGKECNPLISSTAEKQDLLFPAPNTHAFSLQDPRLASKNSVPSTSHHRHQHLHPRLTA